MKRPPSTPIPEFPAWPRRKRSLSEEERALWESVAKQTKPLRKKHRAAKPPAGDSPATEAPAAAKPAPPAATARPCVLPTGQPCPPPKN